MISAVLPLIIIVLIFFLIVRIATIFLKLTGMDENTAWFQSVSAFTGTGFTTKEAETILEGKIRRKTVIILMILGKVGFVSVIAGLFVSFGKDDLGADLYKAAILIGCFFIIYWVTNLKGFSRTLNRLIEKSIIARKIIKQRTLEELFDLPQGYGLAQLTITSKSKEEGLSLVDAGFSQKDILVLSIERKDQLISFPHAKDVINKGDKLLCYGLIENIKEYAS